MPSKKMGENFFLLALLLLLVFQAESVQAKENFYGIAYDKYDRKKEVSWNLADWLIQKQEFAAMDHWLAMNTAANLFEFYLQAGAYTYDLSNANSMLNEEDYSLGYYRLGAFVTIWGVEVEKRQDSKDLDYTDGRTTLMLFGRALQGSNLLAYYGYRDMDDFRNGYSFKTNYYGGTLNLYLLPILGVFGDVKQYMESNAAEGVKAMGNYSSIGVFVDISIFRLVFEGYTENWTFTQTGSETKSTYKGANTSLQIFF